MLEDERVYFGKKVYFDPSSKDSNDTKNVEFHKTRRFNDTNSDKSIRVVGTEKKRGFIHTFSNSNKVQNQSKGLRARAGVFHTTRIFKIYLENSNNSKSQKLNSKFHELETEDENLFFNQSKPGDQTKEARHKSHVVFSSSVNSTSLPAFRSRRLLSFNSERDYYTQYDESLVSTTDDEEEIESTDPAYQDKDEQINDLTDRLIGKPKSQQVNLSSNVIDSIETRLTKRGKTNVEKQVTLDENQTPKVILHTEHDRTTPNEQTTLETRYKQLHNPFFN